jgi:hypothetical protein
MRKRTVIVEYKIEVLLEVPEDWDKDMIEFHRNEGSWCASNIIEELRRLDERAGCLCRLLECSFLREASEQDEQNYGHSPSSDKPPQPEGIVQQSYDQDGKGD